MKKLREWLFPKKPDPAPALPTVPDPTPEPVLPVVPEPPVVKPSSIQLINYLRVLSILRSIPLARLKAEFLKLPLRKLGWALAVTLWLGLTYGIITAIMAALR